MAIVRDVTVDDADAKRIYRLAQRILRECRGEQKVVLELALLSAYAVVADGVQSMPAATRELRARQVVLRGARALCDVITEIGALDDATVLALSRTCQE